MSIGDDTSLSGESDAGVLRLFHNSRLSTWSMYSVIPGPRTTGHGKRGPKAACISAAGAGAGSLEESSFSADWIGRLSLIHI